MPSRALVRAFLALYITLGAVVVIQSVQTVIAASRGLFAGPEQTLALLLGSCEAVAALLFLIPRTMRIGAYSLVAIFGLAFVLHALAGRPNFALVVYFAATLFVQLHGVRGYHWRAASPHTA
jgi:hypothetical protein